MENMEDKIKAILEDNEDGIEDLAEIIDDSGNIKADFGMPAEFQDQAAAEMMVEHLTNLSANEVAWKAAKANGDQARRENLFKATQFNKLTIALLQRKHPNAKAIANDIMTVKAKTITDARQKALTPAA